MFGMRKGQNFVIFHLKWRWRKGKRKDYIGEKPEKREEAEIHEVNTP